jgi:hypothetical protein
MMLLHEMTHGGWFILSLILAGMFTNITLRAWSELGYGATETKAAISLTTYFVASAFARMWNWLIIWLPQHGYPEQGAVVFTWVWWPILANLIGVAGALCAVRIFYPWFSRKEGMIRQDTTWLMPLAVAIVFLAITTAW